MRVALDLARREVEAGLQTWPGGREGLMGGLGEGAAVTVLAGAGSVPVLAPGQAAPVPAGPSRPRIAGLAGRQDWYFVGRRREQRRWPADLTGDTLAGIVICGIGGGGEGPPGAPRTPPGPGRRPPPGPGWPGRPPAPAGRSRAAGPTPPPRVAGPGQAP